MELVRTTKVIDELLVRAVERALSKRLVDDYEQRRRVDASLPFKFCTDITRGLLCGEYMESVTDSDDMKEWLNKIQQAKTFWIREKESKAEEHDYMHSLGLDQVQHLSHETTKRGAREKLEQLSQELLALTIMVESLSVTEDLLKDAWCPEDSCHRLRSDAIDWVVSSLRLPKIVAVQAKAGEFCLGLTRTEHYSSTLGLYLPNNVTRVRCQLRYPNPLVSIIKRRTTIVHEAVHAVAFMHTGDGDLLGTDSLFSEGLAELCTWRYLKDRLDDSKDWLYMPHSADYSATTPPLYIRAHLQAKCVFELTRDYRILLALLEMRPLTVENGTIRRMHVMDSIERMVQVLGQTVARRLVQDILKEAPGESLPRCLYTVGTLPEEHLLNLVRNFDETFPGLVESCTADTDLQ